jgi:MFS family permease
MITSGRLGDRFGQRRIFTIGFVAFTVASCLCGLAQPPGSLILYRIVQGVASAILSPQVLAIIRVTFASPRERAKAFAWMGVSIGLAGVLGQVVGGVVVSADLWGLSWRPVFLINLPVSALALITAPFIVEESRGAGVQKLDPVGAVFSALRRTSRGPLRLPRRHSGRRPSFWSCLGKTALQRQADHNAAASAVTTGCRVARDRVFLNLCGGSPCPPAPSW